MKLNKILPIGLFFMSLLVVGQDQSSKTGRAIEKGLEMVIAGSPGWCVTGGPWVEPSVSILRVNYQNFGMRRQAL